MDIAAAIAAIERERLAQLRAINNKTQLELAELNSQYLTQDQVGSGINIIAIVAICFIYVCGLVADLDKLKFVHNLVRNHLFKRQTTNKRSPMRRNVESKSESQEPEIRREEAKRNLSLLIEIEAKLIKAVLARRNQSI